MGNQILSECCDNKFTLILWFGKSDATFPLSLIRTLADTVLMTAFWSMNVSLQVWMWFRSFSAWGSCSCGPKRRDLALHWNPMLSNGLQNSLGLKDWQVLSLQFACYWQLSASEFESYELRVSHLCNKLCSFQPTLNNIQSSTWMQKLPHMCLKSLLAYCNEKLHAWQLNESMQDNKFNMCRQSHIIRICQMLDFKSLDNLSIFRVCAWDSGFLWKIQCIR